jgi:hypothetical protein
VFSFRRQSIILSAIIILRPITILRPEVVESTGVPDQARWRITVPVTCQENQGCQTAVGRVHSSAPYRPAAIGCGLSASGARSHGNPRCPGLSRWNTGKLSSENALDSWRLPD